MKLLLGDSAEKLQEISEKSVDLVVTSPPYDNMREYKGYSFDFEKITHELFRVVKDGGVVVWVVGDQTIKGSETGTSFKQALFFKEIGFNIHDTMIYHKLAPPLTHNRYEQHFEYMFVFSKNKPAVWVATLWTYHHGKARWTADLWLKVMLLTGIARISENQLIIPLEDLVEDFQKWQFSTDVFKPKKVRGDLNEDRHELEVGTVQEL